MAKVDNYQLIQKINNLEGLSTDEKSKLIDLLNHSKPYGLVWEEKHESVEDRFVDELPVLEEVAERRIISENAESPNHIIIEGDNLHALTTLAYTHENSIDVIYIDPPYNTGNKDFVYNDSFVDREDNYRHSKWLSFMHKRLTIAKTLLSEKGVIFISIDDNEQANLKLLCDEIFGEGNLLANLVWDLGSGTSAGHFTRAHEYILVYCKNKSLLPNFSGGEGLIDDRAIKKKSIKNAESDYFFKAGTKFEAEDGFELSGEWGDAEKTRLVSGHFCCKEGKLAEDVVLNACWTQRNQMDSFFEGNPTYDTKGQEVVEFYFRDNGKLYCRKNRDKINPPTIIKEVGSTKAGSNKLKEIFNEEEPFGFAKPVTLISFLVNLLPKDSIILDFFAGSGTTLHATMQLNNDDGGNRKCILVTNNENGICENVTYERNKRVIKGYTDSKGQTKIGLINNNLRYYKTDFVGRERNNPNMRKLVDSATDMLCIKNDIYEEQDTFFGNKHSKEILRFFDDGKKMMLIIYLEDAIEDLVEIIDNQDLGGKKIITYVFSPSNDPYTDDFFDVEDKVKLVALPSAIYNAYSKIWSKRRIERLKKIIDEIREEKKDNEVSEPQLSLDFENNNTDNQQ